MSRSDDLYSLPADLPVPADDGACDHLVGMAVPSIGLPSTSGELVNLARLSGRTVVYAYPRTGRPDQDPPSGWDTIPGARGCTPESCSFRDHHQELRSLGARVFGLSTQDTAYQQEAAARLHLPFDLLSDADLALTGTLRLPTFVVGAMTLLKRLTLVINYGRIEHVWYPVFPPDTHAEVVVAWLAGHQASSS
jgi:peroxiredoxin